MVFAALKGLVMAIFPFPDCVLSVLNPGSNTPFCRRIVALLLPMFATEIMLAIIPTLNAFSCNLRTRSFNNFLFQVIQIPTAYLFGLVLDKLPLARPKRGLVALGISFSVTLVGWVRTSPYLLQYGWC